MKYTIRTMYGKKYIVDNINTYDDLENNITTLIGTPPNKQRLLLNGKLITSLPKSDSVLYLVFKLIGG